MPIEYLLPILFLLIAFVYSSIGFGGGSSYLAIMSLFLTDFHEIRSMALLLNLTVVSIGTLMYMRYRVFEWKSFWPFLLPSVPMAYFGAQMRLSEQVFFLILGSLLVVAAIAMVLKLMPKPKIRKELSVLKRAGLGGSIGFFAGLSGIGGGIYLSPVLHMMRWKDAYKIASLSSVFILVNSIAGLSGLLVANTFNIDSQLTFKLVGAVFIGGMLGSYLSNRSFNSHILTLLTALLVLYVGIRLILFHGYGIKI